MKLIFTSSRGTFWREMDFPPLSCARVVAENTSAPTASLCARAPLADRLKYQHRARGWEHFSVPLEIVWPRCPPERVLGIPKGPRATLGELFSWSKVAVAIRSQRKGWHDWRPSPWGSKWSCVQPTCVEAEALLAQSSCFRWLGKLFHLLVVISHHV